MECLVVYKNNRAEMQVLCEYVSGIPLQTRLQFF